MVGGRKEIERYTLPLRLAQNSGIARPTCIQAICDANDRRGRGSERLLDRGPKPGVWSRCATFHGTRQPVRFLQIGPKSKVVHMVECPSRSIGLPSPDMEGAGNARLVP